MISALSRQSDLNTYYVHLLHNMAAELTRLNLEVQDLKNRALQLQARLDLQARREKTLEAMLDGRDRGPKERGRGGRPSLPARAASPGLPPPPRGVAPPGPPGRGALPPRPEAGPPRQRFHPAGGGRGGPHGPPGAPLRAPPDASPRPRLVRGPPHVRRRPGER